MSVSRMHAFENDYNWITPGDCGGTTEAGSACGRCEGCHNRLVVLGASDGMDLIDVERGVWGHTLVFSEAQINAIMRSGKLALSPQAKAELIVALQEIGN